MRVIGIITMVDLLLWVVVFFMYATGWGHPKEASELLGSITFVLALVIGFWDPGDTVKKTRRKK